MRILVLPRWGPADPRSRYRIYQYLPYLAAAGHQLRVYPQGDGFALARLLRCQSARRFDLVWIQNPLGAGLAHSLSSILPGLLPRVRVYDSTEKGVFPLANGLTFEADVDPGPLPPRLPILTLRTVPDWSEMEGLGNKPGHNIGWIGTNDTVCFLEEVLPALKTLATSHRFVLKIVGASISEPGFRCSTLSELPGDDSAFLEDLNLALLPCRSGLSLDALQRLYLPRFLAAGIPVITGLGTGHEKLVAESGAGFVAEDEQAWLAALRKFFENPSLGKRLGERGRDWAKYELSLQAQAPSLVRFFEAVGANSREEPQRGL